MLWLYILIALILLLALVLLMPVSIKLKYKSDLTLSVYVGFIKAWSYPQKPKKKKSKQKKKQAKKPPEKVSEKKEKKKRSISQIAGIVKKIAELAAGVLKDFFKHIIVKKMLLSIKIAGSNAADTAVKYGACCSAVYPAFGTIAKAVKYKECGVDISPDFEENAKSEVFIELNARVSAFWIIGLVLKHGVKGLKLLTDLNKGE